MIVGRAITIEREVKKKRSSIYSKNEEKRQVKKSKEKSNITIEMLKTINK